MGNRRTNRFLFLESEIILKLARFYTIKIWHILFPLCALQAHPKYHHEYLEQFYDHTVHNRTPLKMHTIHSEVKKPNSDNYLILYDLMCSLSIKGENWTPMEGKYFPNPYYGNFIVTDVNL